MLACVDVHYREDGSAVAACLELSSWTADVASARHVVRVESVEGYRPGAFYRRELPCLRRALAEVREPLEAIVVDAYVTLDPGGRPGLGARLHESLGESVPIVGVAKTRYAAATHAIAVRRGESASPLWVTAVGMDPDEAAARVRSMHGPYRMPTLLREVDRLARAG